MRKLVFVLPLLILGCHKQKPTQLTPGLVIQEIPAPCEVKTHNELVNILLRDEYEDLNWAYFDGRLPKDTVVMLDEEAEEEGDVSFTRVGKELMGPYHYYIGISPRYSNSGAIMKESLLHEMAHIDLYDRGVVREKSQSHGPEWQHEMTDLAIRGAFKDSW